MSRHVSHAEQKVRVFASYPELAGLQISRLRRGYIPTNGTTYPLTAFRSSIGRSPDEPLVADDAPLLDVVLVQATPWPLEGGEADDEDAGELVPIVGAGSLFRVNYGYRPLPFLLACIDIPYAELYIDWQAEPAMIEEYLYQCTLHGIDPIAAQRNLQHCPQTALPLNASSQVPMPKVAQVWQTFQDAAVAQGWAKYADLFKWGHFTQLLPHSHGLYGAYLSAATSAKFLVWVKPCYTASGGEIRCGATMVF